MSQQGGDGLDAGELAARTTPPVFPRVPAARVRGRRRRPVATAVIAGVIGGLIGVLLARGVPPNGADPPAAAPDQAAVAMSAGPQEEIAEGTVARVARAVLPSVVRINRSADEGLEGGGNGSGVVYRSDGFIVTNNHVVDAPGTVEVVFADGETLPAQIVGQDAMNDLAVIRVQREDLPAIATGMTRGLDVGDLAIAVGSPFGLDATVTVGVVSALGRGIHAGGHDGVGVYLPEVIQTDAPINPGNSGGALVDGGGRLIGINSAILTSGQAANAGVGFAIPVDTVIDVADELIATGVVRHPLLGVSGGPVSEPIAERLGVDAGAWIDGISPDTPASAAGLAPDDVIVAVDDRAITSMEDLIIAIRDHDVGDRVTVTYVRNGKRRSTQVVLAERSPDSAQ